MSNIIEGYALLFGVEYNFGYYVERVAPGALKKANMKDVRLLKDHNMSQLFGRTTAGTLKLEIDKTGLFFRASLPSSESAAELLELIERRDLCECSWAFNLKDEDWSMKKLPDGRVLRTIENVREVFDVTVTAFPANPQTKVWVRPDLKRSDSMDNVQNVAFVDYDPETSTSTLTEARMMQTRAGYKPSFMPEYECASLSVQNEARARVEERITRFASGSMEQSAPPAPQAPPATKKDPATLLKEIEAKKRKYEADYADMLRRENAKQYAKLSEREKLQLTEKARQHSEQLAAKYKNAKPPSWLTGTY